MIDFLTNFVTEEIQDELAGDKEKRAKGNIAQRPAVLQRAKHQQNLRNYVYKQEQRINDIQ